MLTYLSISVLHTDERYDKEERPGCMRQLGETDRAGAHGQISAFGKIGDGTFLVYYFSAILDWPLGLM